MSNGNEPAYPHLHDSCQQVNSSEHWPGLTKREVFVKAAMEGLLARYGVCEAATDTAVWAWEIADAMLVEGKKRK